MVDLRLDITTTYEDKTFTGYGVWIFENGKPLRSRAFSEPSQIRKYLSDEINTDDADNWLGTGEEGNKRLIRLIGGKFPISKCLENCGHSKHTGKPRGENFIRSLESVFPGYELKK